MNDDYLFEHKGSAITVTRHWFRMGNQSHAVHYLRRLTLDVSAPPRRVAMIVFFIALLLTLIQIVHILRDTLPPAIAWLLFIACITLMIVSSYIAFVQADKHKLIIDFNDGESLSLALPGASTIVNLHDALREAMDTQPEGRLSSNGGVQQGNSVDGFDDADQNSRQNVHRAYVIGTHKSGRRDS